MRPHEGSTSKALVLLVAAVLVAACGGSMPTRSERVDTTEAKIRSARERGAEHDSAAAYHLKLAEEQLAQARALMRADDTRRADRLIQKADADATYAVTVTRDRGAKTAPRPRD